MYRQYENPHMLQDMLKAAEAELEAAKKRLSPDDADCLIDYYMDVESLKDRIRFAWDDIEYDENY